MKLSFSKFLLLLLFSQITIAQSSANYAFTTGTNASLASDLNSNIVDMSTGTTQLIGAGLDATASTLTNLDFDFIFMGTRFSSFSVNEDGILQFGITAVGTNIYTITGGTSTLPRLAAFNADLRTGTTTGKIHYKVVGTAPNRCLVVEFKDMQLFFTTAATGTSTWQIRLYETTGVIEYVYGAMSVTNISTTNRAPSIGFYTGAATGSFASVSYATHTNSTTSAYTANPNVGATGVITNLDSASDGSRRYYRYSPPVLSNPSPVSFTSVTSSGMTVNWLDVSGELGYYIFYSIDGGINYSFLNSVSANTNSFNISGLASSTLYTLKIIAFNEGYTSSVTGNQITSTISCGSFTTNNYIGGMPTGGTNLNDATKWSLGRVPTECDDAVINLTATTNGTYILSLASSGISCRSLTITWNASGNTTRNLWVQTNNFPLNIVGDLILSNPSTGNASGDHQLILGNNNGSITINGNCTVGQAGQTKLSRIGGLNSTGRGVWTINGNITYNVSGLNNFTRPFVFNRNGNQTLTNNSGFFTDFGSIQIGATNNTSLILAGTATTVNRINGTLANGTGDGTLRIRNGSTLAIPATYTLNQINSNFGGLFLEDGATLRLAGVSGGQTGSNFPLNFGTMILAPTSTVEYYGAGQTVFNISGGYGNLTLSGSGTKTMTGITNIASNFITSGTATTGTTVNSNLTIGGNVIIGLGSTFNAGTSRAHNVAGNWTNNGTFSFTTANTINFNGSSLQTLDGSISTSFSSITLNNSAGARLAIDQTASGSLVLTNGGLILNGKTFTYSGNNITRSTGYIKADDTNSQLTFQNTSVLTLPANVFDNDTIYNMTVNGSGGTSLGSDTTISNQLQLNTGDLNVLGNILTLNGPYITGTPNNLKTSSASTVNFYNTGTGTFNLPNFANINTLNFNNNLELDAVSNVSVNGDLNIIAGSLDLGTFTYNRPTSGGSLSLGSSAQLKIGGTNTFPINYSTHSINSNSTVDYNGTNQNVVTLNSSQNYGYLILSGTGNKTFDDLVTVENNLTNSSTSTATLTSGKSLIIKNQLINDGTADNFVFENNSSLIQINDVSNIGDIKYNRTSPLTVNTTDYVYWTSPVSNNTVSNGFNYYWDNATGTSGNWVAASGQSMTPGRGFILRGIGSRVFSGVPYNGEVTVNVFRRAIIGYNDNWNLIGNPYASAISADEFIADPDNTSIEGSVAIWTHGSPNSSSNPNPFYGSYTYNYNPNDYIIYNSFAAQSGPSTFNGYIAAGQAFFVKMIDGSPAASGTVKFKNSMRTNTSNLPYNNSQFYRNSSENSSTEAIEKHRIWLDIVNSNNLSYRTTLGYASYATDEKDRIYDAYTAVNPSNMSIYSLLNSEKLAIKANALPFEENDVFPLGYNAPQAGNYSIAIHALDGLFESQNVYLEDTQLNIIHNLKINPYSFSTNQGENNIRFRIVFSNQVLENTNFEIEKSLLIINKNDLKLISNLENIESVFVYDLLGRIIYERNKINNKQFIIPVPQNNSPLILKIILQNGIIVERKTLY